MYCSRQTLPGKVALIATAGFSIAISAPIPSARADVRYTTETQIGDKAAAPDGGDSGKKDAAPAPTIRTATFVKGKRERVETAMEMGPVKSNTVTLTICEADKRQIITMDPDLKLYTVAPMDSGGASGEGATAAPGETAKPSNEKEDTGRVVTTYDIKDMGMEKVGDINAHHYLLTLRIERSGCAGKGDSTMKMETWVAPGQLGGLSCPERAPSTTPQTRRNDKGCRITFETKGDSSLMQDVFKGMVVRQRMYSGDKVAMTQEVKEISSAALEESLFAPPADYKQVPEKEYADAKRKALMAGMTVSGSPNTAGTSGEAAPPPKKKRGGLFGGLGGALGGAVPGAVSGSLGSVGAGALAGLGGQAGLGGIATALGSGMLGSFGGYSPIALPGGAGQTLGLLGSLSATK
jgi:hypothetical protein